MFKLHNWVQKLVQLFTFYGDRAGGGGTVGGGKPSSLAPQGQPNMPSQPMFAGGGRPFNPQANQNAQYLMNFSDGRFPQGMPPMPQGLLPSQGLPMQGGAFAGGDRPFNLNPALVKYSRPPNLAPQNMGQPTQQQMFQPRGNLNPALVKYSRPPNLASQGMPTMPQGMNQPQGLPMQGGQFAGGDRPFNLNPALVKYSRPPNFTS